jgi:glucokinase
MTELTLALDIGGTKIAAGLVDGEGTLVHQAKLPTPQGDAETVWAVVDSLVTEALATAGGGVRGVGIASAGPIDLPSGTVSPINITQWQRFPIVDRVSTAVGAPVRLGGDGLCMALGEQWRGAGRGAEFLLGMVVSTGVGGGLVLDGAPYDGRTGNAGHVGHVVVDPDGAKCTCGGHGCVETIAAGPRMAQWARENGWDAPAEADAKELADAAYSGHPVALRAFYRGGSAVAAMIASVAAVCDLDLVVIGGGVAKAGRLLFEPVRQGLESYAGLDFIRDLRVVPAELGGDAGLVGAAKLAEH